VLDQHPDRDLVRQPDVRPGQPALGDLAPEDLDVLGDAGGKPVTELGVGVEPVKLMVRPGDLKRGPGDLRGARQRGRGARVEQPRPAPHQRHQEELGHRVQIERQQRAVTVRRVLADDAHRRGGPAVPPGDRYRDLESVVHHGARADHRRPLVDQPATGRIPVSFHPGQPDPVAVASDVERVRPADVGDPGSFWCRPDHPGPPGQPAASRNRQVNLWAPPEHQMAAFGKPDDLARRGTDVRCHWISVGRGYRRKHPRIRGWRSRAPLGLTSFREAPGAA
jgi:hypothetical protein